MKISQEMRSQIESTTKNVRTAAGQQTFDGMVQSQTQKLKQQELQQLMKDITMQGDKLARFRSFRDLVKFKRMVKGFLKETVYNGLDLQKSYGFSLDGQNRKLAIVKEVDEKLVELTEEIMNQEKKTVDLLGLIGEIKGLLINLYT
ncbi:YaaR family protein [Virgibacillus ndiopensis]|uniref:YaaR family protein n=1 Tax=Virgibacillus ndiopensis TaxID=2004408 RepID=UPI000C082D7C|nr:YaaR family protein [Virgibacillus ndiopensis]